MFGFLSGCHELILAFALFLLSHIIPARPGVRRWLFRQFGKASYLWTYADVSIFLFGWLIMAANRAPYVPLWNFYPWQTWIPNVAMPFASLLLAFGIAMPNPLSIASRKDETFNPDRPGFVGVTRHPVLWAAALWAFAHMVPNGDLAHVLLFGSFCAFSLSGMLAIDARHRRVLGEAPWHHLTRHAPLLPFGNIGSLWLLSFRKSELVRLIAAASLYFGILLLHAPLFGVSPLPPLQ